jgi:hypothetical protein
MVDRRRQDWPGAVILIATIQFVVSALIWLPSGLLLLSDAIMAHRYAAAVARGWMALPKRSHEYYEIVIGIPLCLSVIGLFTGIGLLRMRNWARRVTLYMATVPVFACVVFLHVHHPKHVEGALFAVGDFTPAIAWALLVILVPVSIWWWAYLIRNDVRSRFR